MGVELILKPGASILRSAAFLLNRRVSEACCVGSIALGAWGRGGWC